MLKKTSKLSFLLYFVFSLSLIFTSCEKKRVEEENPRPTPTVPAPATQPTNPSECVTKASADNGQEIAGQYIIKYKASTSDASVKSDVPNCATRARIASKIWRRIYQGKFNAAVAKLTQEQVNNLKSDSEVESVEPDRVISIVSCSTPVPAQAASWGVQRVGGGDGRGKTIWIIDSGVDLTHPDLTVDASRSKSFITGTTPNDDNGHGTHVAGIIAAKNNSIGVLGVAAGATIVSLKVMDANGKGSSSTVAEAVNYVAENAKAGDVVNMSVGGGVSTILDNAVIDASNRGILFAIAAGNEHEEASTGSPSRVNNKNVYTVSAINDKDVFASFSNFGKGVDYAAPGVNIASTFKGGEYATMSGTSMAAPHLAGLLLLKGTSITTNGFAKEDPDGKADPIAHK